MSTDSFHRGAQRPRLLDVCCGAGGASMGYHLAGFDVVGVDVIPQPRYPFEFHQADAVEFIRDHGQEFDVIAGSPPCKVHTDLKAFSGAHHIDMIPDVRKAMIESGHPYVIENVPGAPLLNPVQLCGSAFDLGVERHRRFESNIELYAPACDHSRQAAISPGYPVRRYHSGQPVITQSRVVGVFGRGQGLGPGEVDLWRRAMGIDWMTREELREAIPPRYTEYLGRQLIRHLATIASAVAS